MHVCTMYMYVYVCTFVCTYVQYVFIFIYTYVCVCVCYMYIYVPKYCTYINFQILRFKLCFFYYLMEWRETSLRANKGKIVVFILPNSDPK